MSTTTPRPRRAARQFGFLIAAQAPSSPATTANGPWRALADATTREHHQGGGGQDDNGDDNRYPVVAQVQRTVRHPREQQRTGSPVHNEADRGQQAQKSSATPHQPPGAPTIATKHQPGSPGRGDVCPQVAPLRHPSQSTPTRRLAARGGSGKK